MLASDPSRVMMARGEIIPLEFNVSALVEVGQTIDSYATSLTRIDPYPSEDAPSSWRGIDTIDGETITQYVDSTDLSEGYIYQLQLLVDILDGVDTSRYAVEQIIEIETTLSVNTRGVSRLQLRQDIGTETGDMILCRATGDATNVTFVDTNKLWRPRDEYIGRIAYFVGGTPENLQLMRKVIAADSSTAVIQWTIGVNEATQEGDIVELWSRNGNGWDPDEVNRVIRRVHEEASAHFQLPATAEIGAFSADDPYITVPSSFVAVTGVSWVSPNLPTTGDWIPLDRSRGRNSPGYYVEKETRRVVLSGTSRYTANRGIVRIHGYVKERPLEYDADVTNLNAEYLIARAKELLWNQLGMKTDKPQIALNNAAMHRQEAMVKRAMVVPRRAANVDWIG